MTTRFLLATTVTAALLAMGASAGSAFGLSEKSSTTTTTSASSSGATSNKKFEKCLKKRGVKLSNRLRNQGRGGAPEGAPPFELGQGPPNGGGQAPQNMSTKQRKALRACQKYAPNGTAGGPGGPGGGSLSGDEGFADCLRDHGLTPPDPTTQSDNSGTPFDPNDPNVQQALQECRGAEPSTTTTSG